MVEPSDVERAGWPQSTAAYVADLERQLNTGYCCPGCGKPLPSTDKQPAVTDEQLDNVWRLYIGMAEPFMSEDDKRRERARVRAALEKEE